MIVTQGCLTRGLRTESDPWIFQGNQPNYIKNYRIEDIAK